MSLTINWRIIFRAFKNVWPLWLALSGFALSVGVGWLLSQNVKDAVLYAGTVFQLLGLILVAIGLSETRRLFGCPSLLHKFWEFFRQLASAFVTPKSMTLDANDLIVRVEAGEATLISVARPEDSLEVRVSILEENFNFLRNDLAAKN